MLVQPSAPMLESLLGSPPWLAWVGDRSPGVTPSGSPVAAVTSKQTVYAVDGSRFVTRYLPVASVEAEPTIVLPTFTDTTAPPIGLSPSSWMPLPLAS